jgi:UDP-glucose 4-epimerase
MTTGAVLVTGGAGYYGNNTAASRNLIEICVAKGVERFVFSSTAAVYGIPEKLPVPETAPTRPINRYGRSKLITESMLEDVAASPTAKLQGVPSKKQGNVSERSA